MSYIGTPFRMAIGRDLQSGTDLDKARAVILHGFLGPEPGSQWLAQPTEDDSTWYQSVLRVPN